MGLLTRSSTKYKKGVMNVAGITTSRNAVKKYLMMPRDRQFCKHLAEKCYSYTVLRLRHSGLLLEVTDSISKDLQFVIDDISNEDSLAVGVTWHLAWQGKPFPFSKGCSFYRLEVVNGKKQIIYGRDSVEPFIKPGESALVAIKGVTWLFQRFPQLADKL
ncbi:hypothetical protein C5167_013383 [Papaver somniferum]|uniref:Uncharacterized protein n=1 Tax=Papaver somniferum TaxID=3469 RepID=A0A4Y7J393_PAPSO|nr:hypothetical protein C5167_013383 [Papaver somniferum]